METTFPAAQPKTGSLHISFDEVRSISVRRKRHHDKYDTVVISCVYIRDDGESERIELRFNGVYEHEGNPELIKIAARSERDMRPLLEAAREAVAEFLGDSSDDEDELGFTML